MRRWSPIRLLAVPLIAVLASSAALAQSQADRTGRGGVTVAAGQETPSLLTHPITIGAVVAGVLGVALAIATDGDSPVATTTTTSTTQ